MKKKFNPKDVPSWARWLAVDENGTCAAYRTKPTPIREQYQQGYWSIDGFDLSGKTFVDLYKGKPPKNWKAELYTWS